MIKLISRHLLHQFIRALTHEWTSCVWDDNKYKKNGG